MSIAGSIPWSDVKVSTACPPAVSGCFKRPLPCKGKRSARLTQSPAVGVIHLTIELAVVLAVPQNDATTIVSLSLNLTRLQSHQKWWDQHTTSMVSPASRTMVFESSMGCQMDLDVQEIYVSQWFNHHRLEDVGPSPWTLWRDFCDFVINHCQLASCWGLSMVERQRSVPLLQDRPYLPFSCSKIIALFDLVQMQETSKTTLARVWSAWTLQINPGLGSENCL